MRLGIAAAAALALGCAEHEPLEVAEVELGRFEGGWYEIAKIPRATQSGCTGPVAVYRVVSKTELDVYSECHEGELDGPLRRMAARAKVGDPDEPAKLSLDFGGFFGDYWIVDVAADYRYAAVGHPSRDYLWILSRTPEMEQVDFDAVVLHAQNKGFDTARLERTLQAPAGEAPPPPATESIPPPTDHGCSLTPRPGTGAFVVAFAFALGALGFARRRAR
jgi:apolipoprotein D and lipocalin family protein